MLERRAPGEIERDVPEAVRLAREVRGETVGERMPAGRLQSRPRQVMPKQEFALQQQLPHSEAACVVQHADPRHLLNLAAATRIAA